VTEKPRELACYVNDIFEPQIRPPRHIQCEIVMLNRTSFFRTVKKEKLSVFKVSLYDTNMAIEAKDSKERPLEDIVREQHHEFIA